MGGNGNGSLLITDGGKAYDFDAIVGASYNAATEASGTVTVQGAGSLWMTAGIATIGDGTGTLNVLDGATAYDGGCVLGDSANTAGGSSGIANIDGVGSTWTHNEVCQLGVYGSGVMNVTNGASVISAGTQFAYGPSSIGTATIDGAGSLWLVHGDMFIGVGGSGTLHIADGARVESHGMFEWLGSQANAYGLVTIDGPDSVWQNDSAIDVGYGGTGKIVITNSGALENGSSVYIAPGAGTVGTIMLAGAGSHFANSGIVAVGGTENGSDGLGVLSVDAGANVDTGSLTVWDTGTVEITAAPSGVGYIHASSTATLQGALTIDFDDGDYSAGTYTLLQADAGLGGTRFAPVTIHSLPAGFDAEVRYDDDHVDLVLYPTGDVIFRDGFDGRALRQSRDGATASIEGTPMMRFALSWERRDQVGTAARTRNPRGTPRSPSSRLLPT